MCRTLFHIPIPLVGGSVPVHSYGLMMAVGFFVAVCAARRRARREGVDPDIIGDLAVYLLFSGIVGARAFYIFQNIDEYRGSVVDVFKVYEGGLVFYGGLIAAMGALVLFVRVRKVRFLLMMDIVSASVVLGLAFGRIGCFLNGCCYGDVARAGLFCSVRFPRTVDGDGLVTGSPVFLRHYGSGLVEITDSLSLPVHPAQIYSFLVCVSIFFMLNAFWKYRRNDGDVMLLFGIAYSTGRFCLEFIRDDNPPLVDSLTISQNISVVIFLVSLMFFVRSFRRKTRLR